MIWKTSLFFSGGSQGWSETYFLNNTGLGSLNPNAADPINISPLMAKLAQLRANLLGTPFTIFGYRISLYSINPLYTQPAGRSVYVNRTFWTQSQTSQTGPAEPADVGLIMVGKDVTGFLVDRHTLGAPSDAGVDNGGNLIAGGIAGNIPANFKAFSQFLIGNGFGFGSAPTGTVVQLKGVTISQNADGTVDFTWPGGTVLPFAIGKTFPARASGINTRHSALNGQMNLFVTAANILTTREVIGIPTAQQGGQLRVYQIGRNYAAYSLLYLEQFVGNHRRGRPPLPTRGRAPARIRG